MAQEGRAIRHVFLTGRPGVGKTTAVRRVASLLQERGVAAQGFFTEECRQHAGRRGGRTGFDIVALDGRRWPLARLIPEGGPRPRQPVVGRYAVDVDSFEREAVPLITRRPPPSVARYVAIVDEVGKMESFSHRFLEGVHALLADSRTQVIGTIPEKTPSMAGLQKVIRAIRERRDCEVITVDEENRSDLPEHILQLLGYGCGA